MIKSLSLILFLVFCSACKEDEIVRPVDPPPPPSGASIRDFEPSWSPDGHTIAYFHIDTSASTTGIFLIDTNGTNKRQLVTGYCGSPDFSPDGNWIVFHSGQIYKMKINGDSLTQLTNGGSNYYPSWSPDGDWIVYDDPIVGSYNILKVKKDGVEIIGICYDARMPSWSPNGSNLVLQKYLVVSGNTSLELFKIDTTNQNPIRITNNNNDELYPRISPDGQKILFTQKHETSLNYQIYTIQTDGSGLTKLTDTQGYTSDFSPDGEKIVYCDSSPNNGRLWIMNKDGTNKRQLTFP